MSNLSVVSETRLEIEWVAVLSGDTPTADYRPTASQGVSEALVQEIADICTRMHPHNDAAQFPRDRDVYLFFRSAASQDYIVTRVSAVSGGNRLALRYYSLIFRYADFSALHFNPFQTRKLGLHDQVQQQHARSIFDPIVIGIQVESLRGSGDVSTDRFIPGAVLSPTEENLRALEEFCARLSKKPQIPPTFATWWAGGQAIPKGYFDIVLRATPMKVITLNVAMDMARAQEATLKATMPNVPGTDYRASELANSILAAAGAVSSAVQNAGSRVGDENAYRQYMAEAASAAAKVSTELGALLNRIGASLTSAERSALTDLAQSYERLADGLPGVPRPANAFQHGGNNAVRVHNAFSTGAATEDAHSAEKGKQPSLKLMMIGVAVFAVVFFVWVKFKPGKEPPVNSKTIAQQTTKDDKKKQEGTGATSGKGTAKGSGANHRVKQVDSGDGDDSERRRVKPRVDKPKVDKPKTDKPKVDKPNTQGKAGDDAALGG